MALRFDGGEWWDRKSCNFYEGDSADGSGGSSTGGADSSAGGQADGSSSDSSSTDAFSGAGLADPSGQYGGITGVDTDTGSVSMGFGYDPGTTAGLATETSLPGSPDDAMGLGGTTSSASTPGFSISSFAMNARKALGPLFSALSFAAKTAMNPIGLVARTPPVAVAPNLQMGMLDRAKALADKQNKWGGTAATGGSLLGGMMGVGPVGPAMGGALAGLTGQLAAGLTDKTAMGMTTGPMGYRDPAAVAQFNGMMAGAQPGGLNAGDDGGIIAAMAKRAGMPAVTSPPQRPAILSSQARAVYQNR